MNPVFFLALVFLAPAMLALLIGASNAASAAAARRNTEIARAKAAAAKASEKQASRAADKPQRGPGRPRKNPPQAAFAAVTLPPVETPKQVEKKAEPERAETVSAAQQPFAGEAVAFTGTCPKLDRRAMIVHTSRLGGEAYKTINTRCTLLVVGENPGKSQLDRAEKWHIKTILWQEWYKRAFGENSLPAPKDVQGITLDEFAETLNAA